MSHSWLTIGLQLLRLIIGTIIVFCLVPVFVAWFVFYWVQRGLASILETIGHWVIKHLL